MQLQSEMPRHRFLLFFSLLYFVATSVSYIVAYKLVKIGPLLDTAAIFIFPLTFTISDIVAEIYGYKVARQLIWSSIAAGFAFCLALVLIVRLPSPLSWHKESAYLVVLAPVFKIYLAVSVGMVCGMFVNIMCITRWKVLLKGRHFWLRSLGSSVIGESIFGIVAASIAFAGKVSMEHFLRIIIVGLTLKILYNLMMVIPASILIILLKRYERVGDSWLGVDPNPFDQNAS